MEKCLLEHLHADLVPLVLGYAAEIRCFKTQRTITATNSGMAARSALQLRPHAVFAYRDELIVASNQEFFVFSQKAGRFLRQIFATDGVVNPGGVTAQGALLTVDPFRRQICLHSLTDGQRLRTVDSDSAFRPNGACVSDDGLTVYVWNETTHVVESFSSQLDLQTSSSPMLDLHDTPSYMVMRDQHLFTSSFERYLQVTDLATSKTQTSTEAADRVGSFVVFGNQVIGSGSVGNLWLWDRNDLTKKPRRFHWLSMKSASGLCVLPATNQLLVCDAKEGIIHVFM